MKKEGYYIIISPLKGNKRRDILLSGFKLKLVKIFIFLAILITPLLIYSVYYLYSNIANYIYLKRKVAEYESKVKKLEVIEGRLDKIIKYTRQINYMLGVEQASENVVSETEGSFNRPENLQGDNFILPVEGIISRSFSKSHPAIDIVVPAGTPVVACMDGSVVEAGFSSYLGFYIKLKHNGGFHSIYGHLRRIFVKSGQSVNKGEIIGEVGSTGKSTGPHLHFEMLKNSKPFNPAFICFAKIF